MPVEDNDGRRQGTSSHNPSESGGHRLIPEGSVVVRSSRVTIPHIAENVVNRSDYLFRSSTKSNPRWSGA